MKKKFIVLSAFLTIVLLKVNSQTDSSLWFSLNEAQEYALEHNQLILNSQLAINASKKQTWQAIANYLPQATATFDYTNFFNYEMEFNFGMSEDVNFTEEQLNEATAQTLNQFPGIPMAGISGVTPQDLYNHNAGSYFDKQLQSMLPPTTILMSDQMSAKLQVSQLILSAPLIIGIKTAKIAENLSQQSFEKTKNDVREIVANAYYSVLLTKETLQLLEGNLKNLEKNVIQSEAAYRAGIMESFDVDQLKMALANVQNAYKSLERLHELSKNMFKFQMGLPVDEEVFLKDSLQQLISSIDFENTFQIAFDLNRNIDYQMLLTQEKLVINSVNMEKAAYLPTIAAFYNYNEKIKTTGFDMNPKNLAGVSLSWPLFTSWSRNAKVQEAKINLHQLENTKEMMNTQLLLQEKQLRFNLKTTLDNYSLQKDNMLLSKRVYQNYERKYNQGMVSSLELTTANNNFITAQNNYLNAVLEVLQAKLALDKLLNTL
ncbi:MAG: TolC family protein [Bacteroidales bacterium]|nr:TolC family protein [Bacteroidales bacterium]